MTKQNRKAIARCLKNLDTIWDVLMDLPRSTVGRMDALADVESAMSAIRALDDTEYDSGTTGDAPDRGNK